MFRFKRRQRLRPLAILPAIPIKPRAVREANEAGGVPVANACAHGELEAIGKHAFRFMTGRAGDGAGRREACVKIQRVS